MDASERRELEGVAASPLPLSARAVIGTLTLAGIAVSIYQLFNIQIFGIVLIEGRYLYVLAGVFIALTFLAFPLQRARGPRWHDWALFALTLIASAYFVWTAESSLEMGWEFAAPDEARWLSILLYILILEATRRAGGLVLFIIVLLVSLYPTVADQMPGPISGFASPFWDLAPYHMISSESSFGIPMRAFGELVIGFIVFGAVLQQTGGGKFFNDLALALVGRYRGGAAKVSIFASGFMGSMSGSVISNVLTTGAVSIPAMKKTGFSARYAAATEACASTGGVLMPPIMGATAFVMASFLSRPYVDIAVAAAIPSLLFYFGLFAQIDSYSARRGLRGMAREDVPRLLAAFREGWLYVLVFAVLIYMMIALRMERLAPFYATGLLLLINQLLPQHRFSLASFGTMIVGVGRSLAELTAILVGVGLIVGAFAATGLSGTLVNELIFIAGDSTIALILMGALTAFIFGMGMTVTACYIFLAVVLAPALVQTGLNELAVHLFILYWGMVSYITPPVALGAFAAATMAGATPMRTGLEAMRLGGVIYIVPFFFLLNPALIGEGSASQVALTLSTALLGIWLISAALQGYVSLIGGLGSGPLGMTLRVTLGIGGFCLAMPGGGVLGLSQGLLFGLGVALSAPAVIIAAMNGRAARANPA
ncbi:TRAP transporter fused permease subunit [Pikeienuella sp. HZG-20]|uniref:TRAP transporter permease n=1 Tax=Paludibacillus litoralis TaxID=3133267 RepID=UPI0030EDB948